MEKGDTIFNKLIQTIADVIVGWLAYWAVPKLPFIGAKASEHIVFIAILATAIFGECLNITPKEDPPRRKPRPRAQDDDDEEE